MNHILIFLTIFVISGVILFIIVSHDASITNAKINQIFKNIRANETCAELKSDMIFTDNANQGLWFKSSYDSDVLKNYKEKNCS